MNIQQINTLFANDELQKALIAYFDYAFAQPAMADSALFNFEFTRHRLERHLRAAAAGGVPPQAASIGARDAVTLPFALPWTMPDGMTEAGGGEETQWWRLDFVVDPGPAEAPAAGQLMVPLPLLTPASPVPQIVRIPVTFTAGKRASAILQLVCSVNVESAFEGLQMPHGRALAFSMQRIEDAQLYRQILGVERDRLPLSLDTLRDGVVRSSQPEIVLGADFLQRYAAAYTPRGEGGRAIAACRSYQRGVLLKLEAAARLHAGQDSAPESVLHKPTVFDGLVEEKWQLGDGVNLNIEGLRVIDDTLIVNGWIVDPGACIHSLRISRPDTASEFELKDRVLRIGRPDVVSAFGGEATGIATHYGFTAVVGNRGFAEGHDDFEIYVGGANGTVYREALRATHMAADEGAFLTLMGILQDGDVSAEQCDKFLAPVCTVFTPKPGKITQPFERIHGPANVQAIAPTLSIVIPLYGDTRFELTQIPAIAALRRPDWEIILAVDDPSILALVNAHAERLAMLYGVVVRVVSPNVNLGFSGINNFAVQRARGENLLFLNSDCFISTVEPVLAALRWLQTERAGAAGFRLQYADQTTQHDGMSVAMWKGDPAFYLNDHPRIGTPSQLMRKTYRNDPAVMLTAACLLMSRACFDQIGGFNQAYLRGDFEDSDLCLKLLSRGLKLGIVRQNGIFHLERQTIAAQDGGIRQRITLVNSYLYSQRWGGLLSGKLPALEVIA